MMKFKMKEKLSRKNDDVMFRECERYATTSNHQSRMIQKEQCHTVNWKKKSHEDVGAIFNSRNNGALSFALLSQFSECRLCFDDHLSI